MRYGKSIATKHSQRGITLVLISLIMLILIGMGAFAIDLNHQVLNKTRLQNAVDSAALASAVVADDTGNALLAKSAAVGALTSFAAASGNQELVYGEENISITFSNDLQTFVDAKSFSLGSDSDIYIRVAVSDVSLTQYLSYIFGVGKDVSASAVAGPSAPITTTCNVAPIGMCGDSDPLNGGGPDTAWGYLPNSYYDSKTDKDPSSIHVLKPPSHEDGGIGAGNFHLLDFGSGKNTVRDLLAGATKQCLSVGDEVSTEPGVGKGPVEKGLNTRLETTDETTAEGETIKPDKYLEESNVTYENYKNEYANNTTNAFYYADYHSSLASCKAGKPDCNGDYYKESGLEGRRILRVPIIKCSEPPKNGGAMEGLEVLGLGCFFITQKTDGKVIFGQFLEECSVKNASTGISPNDSFGPYKIQLYKDPLSEAS
ncbi:pilus assembly protein TadG-related protein [Vibrio alfacsensis]|uniref:pilus assembly protein TadG-related protein n=1 Tax=Vibrio alfacsensis TaxID=1074311 RepID=UPI004068A36F